MINHYTSFFRLKENPFVLTPDPKYLYLGQKHREVLSHLLYGIKDDKGFMVVVGEVGTGKTTLCRAFINQLLQENIEVGLVYNPAMTDLELLQAINREFKISSDYDSKGKLIDTLNEFLLKVNGEGRKVVLIIDEAQNLDASVLEQLRLISNLETETGKLIQIILVGQPELEKILSKKEMRQLDQRIVVRGLLGPLKPKETTNYIRHRLNIASSDTGDVVSFSDGACKIIHKLSRGIPRLINVLGDRSLLVAFAQGKTKIDKKIIKNAHRDLESSRYRPKSRTLFFRWQTAGIFCLLILTLLVWLYRDYPMENIENPVRPKPVQKRHTAPSKEPPKPQPVVKEEVIDEEPNPEKIMNRLFHPMESLSKGENWRQALKLILRLWNEEEHIPPGLQIEQIPRNIDMEIREIHGNMTLLKSLNYPAIVELKQPMNDSRIYAVVKRLTGEHVVIVGENEEILPLKMFMNIWFGHAYIPWKDFDDLPRIICPGTSSLAVIWLQYNLKYLNLIDGIPSGFYDMPTREAVIQLQKRYSLEPDGIVGPHTKMILYSLLDCYDKPSLWGDKATSSNEEIGSYPYSLHLGSHNNLEMAKRSILDLRGKGISPYLSRVDLGDKGIWYRIFTGHFRDVKEAERFRQEHVLAANIKNTPYTNLIGTYSDQDELQKEIKPLKESGYFPYTITYDDGKPRLFVGAFLTRAGAEKQYRHLESKGIRNRVVTR